MTDRKPPGMGFTSWIDQQIADAERRWAFDNLPGAAEPIPAHPEEADYGQAWLRYYARREGVPQQELLPEPLKPRKKIETLNQTLRTFGSERELRGGRGGAEPAHPGVAPDPGRPPVFVPLLDLAILTATAPEARVAGQPRRLRDRWRRLLGRSLERPGR